MRKASRRRPDLSQSRRSSSTSAASSSTRSPRSPLLVLNARMRGGATDKAIERAAYKQRVLFDYWAHEASLCHIDDLALHHWQMRRWLKLPRRQPYADFLRANEGFAD